MHCKCRAERATRCSVCRGRYSTVMGQPAGRVRAWTGLSRAMGACAVCLLAFGLSGAMAARMRMQRGCMHVVIGGIALDIVWDSHQCQKI